MRSCTLWNTSVSLHGVNFYWQRHDCTQATPLVIGHWQSHDQPGHSPLMLLGVSMVSRPSIVWHSEYHEHTVKFYILRPPQGYSLSPGGCYLFIVFNPDDSRPDSCHWGLECSKPLDIKNRALLAPEAVLQLCTRAQQRNKTPRTVTSVQLVPRYRPRKSVVTPRVPQALSAQRSSSI